MFTKLTEQFKVHLEKKMITNKKPRKYGKIKKSQFFLIIIKLTKVVRYTQGLTTKLSIRVHSKYLENECLFLAISSVSCPTSL